jgi:hypothetical protein
VEILVEMRAQTAPVPRLKIALTAPLSVIDPALRASYIGPSSQEKHPAAAPAKNTFQNRK